MQPAFFSIIFNEKLSNTVNKSSLFSTVTEHLTKSHTLAIDGNSLSA